MVNFTSRNNIQTGINADTNLYTIRDIKRVNRTYREFRLNFIDEGLLIEPWLDVGAGESYMRELLAKETGKKIHDSDIDLDLQRYEIEDEYFMTITSFEVLEHLFNPLFHLLELRRLLSSEGNLYLTTPNDYSLIYKLEHILSRKYRPHFHQFCERDIRDILTRAGFEIVRLKKVFRSSTGTIARVSRNGFSIHVRKKS